MDATEQTDPIIPLSIAQEHDIHDYLTPEFIEELELLNIAVDEYDRLLQDSEPKVITASSTVGF